MRLAPIGTFGALAVRGRQIRRLQPRTTRLSGAAVHRDLRGLRHRGPRPDLRACGLNVFTLMRYFKTELLIALTTCSSEAVLPQLVRKLETCGVGRPVVGLVIPAGFSFNLDGSAVYLTMASLFLAQAVGMDLCWQQQLVMVGVMMLTSKGTAGIAGGAFIVLACTLTAVGHIPLAALALIVGIDRLLNEGRVFINVLGNAVGDHRDRQVGERLRPRTSPPGAQRPARRVRRRRAGRRAAAPRRTPCDHGRRGRRRHRAADRPHRRGTGQLHRRRRTTPRHGPTGRRRHRVRRRSRPQQATPAARPSHEGRAARDAVAASLSPADMTRQSSGHASRYPSTKKGPEVTTSADAACSDPTSSLHRRRDRGEGAHPRQRGARLPDAQPGHRVHPAGARRARPGRAAARPV